MKSSTLTDTPTVQSQAAREKKRGILMKKATSVVDEKTNKRLAFGGMLMNHVGVLPDELIEKFSRNEFRPEIPGRLLRAFSDENNHLSHTCGDHAEMLVTSPSRPRIEVLRDTPKPCSKRSADEQVAGMEMMYKMLGWSLSVSGLVVPERRKGFDRILVIGDSLTNNIGFEACDASFPSWRHMNDLDAGIPTNERHPPKNGTYAIRVRDRIEADEELKGLSAVQIVERKIKTATILERELLELVYYMETGKQLDIENFTLCSGSRNSYYNVPSAHWRGGKFRVYWSVRYDQSPLLRAREVVSSL